MVDPMENLEIYRFDFVTDPDDPNIRRPLDDLLSLIENDENFIWTETNLDRGLVRHTIDVVYDTNEDPDLINRIDVLTGEVSYVPVTVTMDISKFAADVNIGTILTGAEDIIKILTERILEVDLSNVESMRREENIIVFNPIDQNNMSVYENSLYLADYYRKVNMDILGGYQVLSDDPVVYYVLDELYQKGEYVPEDIKTISVDRVVLFPVGLTDEEQEYYRQIKDLIDTLVTTHRENGYFSIELGIHNLSDIMIIHELAGLWYSEIVYEKDLQNIVLKHEKVDFGTLPELWYRNNIDIVKRGDFPVTTLYGPWQQFNVGGDYNQIYGKPWYQVILHYGSLLAYRKLGLDDPFIQPFTHSIVVNNDLSITLSLPTYDYLLKFREYFSDILDGYIGSTNDGEQTIFAQPCRDLMDGVIKRWYVQSIDKRSMPMVLPQRYEDGKVEEILIFRSPAVGLYYSDSPLDFENVNIDTVKQGFVKSLRDHYKFCHGNTEPVLLEQIDTMELSELLDLIEVEEEKGITYCYSRNTLLSLNPSVSPITRKQLSEEVLRKALLLEWGLRGLFNVGPLVGLYTDFPRRILTPPRAGSPIITPATIIPIHHEVTGDIYIVSVGFADGALTDLFEIATEDMKELKRLVEELWNSGVFLSYWVSAVQKYSNTVDSFEVNIVNPLLLHAGDSREDGVRAITYLKQIAKI